MNNQFLTNYTDQTFLQRVQQNLRSCSSFLFSISFIKIAGWNLLSKDIENALERGCRGKLITSTYQNFTDIGTLSQCLMLQEKYSNFSCHLEHTSFLDRSLTPVGYHCKGYFFSFGTEAELIIGSSNLTRYALLKNIEWDLLVKGEEKDAVFQEMKNEFQDKWEKTDLLSTQLIREYTRTLEYSIERWDMDYDLPEEKFRPNYMQRKALKELSRYRAMGVNRALVISAVGSGKTLLAAFDVRNVVPKRMLYLVHEGSILMKAKETFQKVFGGQVSYGIFNGDYKDVDAQFLFASNVSMAKYKEWFRPSDFDYILIDECHHSVASTYKSILQYFKPEFLLGLTATPERMDNQDVLEMFGTNVPYELRLREAIINDLIVPFHYFGIRDQFVNYGSSKKEEVQFQNEVVSSENIDFIISEIEAHREKGKLRALAFCKNVSHALAMAEALGKKYSTVCLSGRNSVGERIRAYTDLQDESKPLEILCTVDILNEGVDIPGVNMVLFLRPTESSTVFIQQLGRGLRKYPNKEYVTVLDFIGNSYTRSVQMVLALGSLSENLVMEKHLMHSLVQDDFKALGLEEYGVKIHFDPLSKEEILQYIDHENFYTLSYLKQDYLNYKKYIHAETYPSHRDYWNSDCAPDLLKFMNAKIRGRKTWSYYGFLKGIGEETIPLFTEKQENCISYFSEMLPLVREEEYGILECLLKKDMEEFELFSAVKDSVRDVSRVSFAHALKHMLKSGFIQKKKENYTLQVECTSDFKEYMQDLLQYGKIRYEAEYPNSTVQFCLWAPYRKDQVLLKILEDPKHNQEGTYYKGDTVIIFASLNKDADIQERLNYVDKYLSKDIFQWESKNNLSEKDRQKLIHCRKVMVFLRKMEAENGRQMPFLYCGSGKMVNVPWKSDQKHTAGSLLFHIHMDKALPEELQYDFGIKDL